MAKEDKVKHILSITPLDATAQGSDTSKIQPSVATSRMDIIFQKRITKGLAI